MRIALSAMLGLIVCLAIDSLPAEEPAAKNADSPKPTAGEQVEQLFVGKKNAQAKLPYLIYLPKEYDQKKVPLLLFLHGSGERGIDNLPLVKTHGPPKIADDKSLPFIVVSPQCPTDQRWDAVVLSELLDEIVAKHHVDTNRIYLTGLSMGGSGTWSLAAYQPQRFAAIAPICGRGDLANAEKLGGLPTWVFCGAKDREATVKNAEEMTKAITAAGGTAKVTIYPELAHDCWTVTYDNPEFYTWLLSHQKSQ